MHEIYRMKPNRMPYIKNVFPLIDMRLTRQDCKNWFKKHYNVQYLNDLQFFLHAQIHLVFFHENQY